MLPCLNPEDGVWQEIRNLVTEKTRDMVLVKVAGADSVRDLYREGIAEKYKFYCFA